MMLWTFLFPESESLQRSTGELKTLTFIVPILGLVYLVFQNIGALDFWIKVKSQTAVSNSSYINAEHSLN